MTEIEVLQPGFYSTIQDRGRFGSMLFGVPRSGAMDAYAATMANLLLHNSPDDALLEITLSGPKLRFLCATEIAITGGDLWPILNESHIDNNKVYKVAKGDVLNFGGRRSGCRTYLGVSGGFKTEVVLNSRSWFEGITQVYRLHKGMNLQIGSNPEDHSRTFSTIKVETEYLGREEIKVFPGPEFQQLPEETRKEIEIRGFTVGKNSNRMAIQPNEQVKNNLKPIITGPVIPGTVQLTPSGNLLMLMRDCQTTGGYPRILQVSEEAMNVLSQKIPGDRIRFKIEEII